MGVAHQLNVAVTFWQSEWDEEIIRGLMWMVVGASSCVLRATADNARGWAAGAPRLVRPAWAMTR